ncbi:conserved Plasmodium protein, unknown function [Plasmodium knowlesi strain H]|uniref:Histone RNA hairpin-binding protein RNA-binding domain-containing protein n=3 Tax=Plasmodium knowlesi TaxID=5850 RepID=A0A5K1U6R5_PLAKH|nr:conserved Plasmodium protein, unknown function [Plasmodium knowlesi strain H]OTN67114.1 Uncharacterized protein PKNOH_S07452300 [Plasmodium knowlesi]CAA9988649.1 conserved Plasmodium protein, unknown function [Plasmodium knowlesi strain H]SBO21516.1 conserved Plasmodium protein, unknown function [Plasmodium knowlesi strain H]SBO21923.1 conserved Plasmodium protein, unknown function [Plasmodium knowlesi strain H]VVS78123.1 conserved Plasmodium protein, unknown function [Plasmodium knowlesi s|eukprot:XP_002259626.1 hypothetical protein, conserved in Plasmodium species [Plasmodium knowlesi strain H]
MYLRGCAHRPSLPHGEGTMQEQTSFQKKKSQNRKNDLSEAQMNQRIKNISLTKRLISYERYINAIPKEERREDMKNDWHPETPRIKKNVSLSQWNKEMKKWRKQVHAWGNMSEGMHKYICNLPPSEKYNYLSKLKLPELSPGEIAILRKRNEQIATRALRNIVQGDNVDNNNVDKNNVDNNNIGNDYNDDNSNVDISNVDINNVDNNNVDNNNIGNDYNDDNGDGEGHRGSFHHILDKPLLFLPHNFSGTILNNEFVVIKQEALENSLQSLRKNYEEKYRPLYEKYRALYLSPSSVDNNRKEQSQTGDITVLATRAKGVSANDEIKAYMQNREKAKVSQCLCPVYVKCTTRSSCRESKMKKRF